MQCDVPERYRQSMHGCVNASKPFREHSTILPLVILRSEMIMEKCPRGHLHQLPCYAVIDVHDTYGMNVTAG
jgi:hypothetical protein